MHPNYINSLKKSTPTSPTQNSTDSRTTAFEMWSNFREARNRLKAEKDK